MKVIDVPVAVGFVGKVETFREYLRLLHKIERCDVEIQKLTGLTIKINGGKNAY